MPSDPLPLRGRVALVTGAGRGLGRAFAETLAAMGCDIAVHGMREHGPAEYGEGTTLTDTARQIAEAHGVRTIPLLGDLTRADHVARVRAALDRNLLTTIFVCQQAAIGMMERRTGRIVTISSIAGYGGRASGAIYATSKAAAIHYTRCLAAELRPYNVTANSIAPGDTRTGRFLNTRPVDPDRLRAGGTLERIALVDEVARAVAVFVGPTGDFITGQVLRVDGGSQCWPA